MSRKLKNKKLEGLPGGPNHKDYSIDGYKYYSEDVNNPYNIIPSGNITMQDVPHPVFGMDNLGNSQMMYPGMDYQFPGSEVFELPIRQTGGGIDKNLLLRQQFKESSFNPKAVSPAGAKGLAQIMPSVWNDAIKAGVVTKNNNVLDPYTNKKVQEWYMKDLYNSSFINKPGQQDSVRMAKTLAAYNWGRENLRNHLNEQKSKGVDIYNSYDWLKGLPFETSDYVNKTLLQKDPKFEKEYQQSLKTFPYRKEGGIHIDPSKKGTFKAQATRMGMSVQEAASTILNNKENYSPAMVKKANFAKNFAKQEGGQMHPEYNSSDMSNSENPFEEKKNNFLNFLKSNSDYSQQKELETLQKEYNKFLMKCGGIIKKYQTGGQYFPTPQNESEVPLMQGIYDTYGNYVSRRQTDGSDQIMGQLVLPKQFNEMNQEVSTRPDLMTGIKPEQREEIGRAQYAGYTTGNAQQLAPALLDREDLPFSRNTLGLKGPRTGAPTYGFDDQGQLSSLGIEKYEPGYTQKRGQVNAQIMQYGGHLFPQPKKEDNFEMMQLYQKGKEVSTRQEDPILQAIQYEGLLDPKDKYPAYINQGLNIPFTEEGKFKEQKELKRKEYLDKIKNFDFEFDQSGKLNIPGYNAIDKKGVQQKVKDPLSLENATYEDIPGTSYKLAKVPSETSPTGYTVFPVPSSPEDAEKLKKWYKEHSNIRIHSKDKDSVGDIYSAYKQMGGSLTKYQIKGETDENEKYYRSIYDFARNKGYGYGKDEPLKDIVNPITGESVVKKEGLFPIETPKMVYKKSSKNSQGYDVITRGRERVDLDWTTAEDVPGLNNIKFVTTKGGHNSYFTATDDAGLEIVKKMNERYGKPYTTGSEKPIMIMTYEDRFGPVVIPTEAGSESMDRARPSFQLGGPTTFNTLNQAGKDIKRYSDTINMSDAELAELERKADLMREQDKEQDYQNIFDQEYNQVMQQPNYQISMSMGLNDAVMAGLRGVNKIFSDRETKRNEKDLQRNFIGDQLYNPVSAGMSGSRGDYGLNPMGSNFRLDETGMGSYGRFGNIAKYGGSLNKYQEGDEVIDGRIQTPAGNLTYEQMMALIAQFSQPQSQPDFIAGPIRDIEEEQERKRLFPRKDRKIRATFQEGGEYDLSEEEIMEILRNGGDIEFLD